MMNYLYVDIMLSSVRIIRENGGDPAEVMPEEVRSEGKIRIFTSQEAMEQSASRRASAGACLPGQPVHVPLRRSDPSACAYIEQNYQ